MNQADTEIMRSLLQSEGFLPAADEDSAGVILLNSCAVRENAVDRIGNFLQQLKGRKRRKKGLILGVVGCVPQFEREKMFGDYPFIDFIAGPDTYRSLPAMITNARESSRLAHLEYDHRETYAGIDPVRSGSISAFVPVMRGCNNSCAFCVVPVTRGRERSLEFSSVVDEAVKLAASGYREITLLGQNVNSYRDAESGRDFAALLDAVGRSAPEMRIRFTTSHPKDISESLVRVIAERPNICSHIHLPVQSGSSRILDLMRRGHTRQEYLGKIEMIRRLIPDVAITTDLIAGFCTETDEDHRQTLSLMEEIRFDTSFMFYYSVRPGTWAAKNLQDDVPEAVKKARLQEIIDLQNAISLDRYRQDVVFGRGTFRPGDIVSVTITGASSATLTGVLP